MGARGGRGGRFAAAAASPSSSSSLKPRARLLRPLLPRSKRVSALRPWRLSYPRRCLRMSSFAPVPLLLEPESSCSQAEAAALSGAAVHVDALPPSSSLQSTHQRLLLSNARICQAARWRKGRLKSNCVRSHLLSHSRRRGGRALRSSTPSRDDDAGGARGAARATTGGAAALPAGLAASPLPPATLFCANACIAAQLAVKLVAARKASQMAPGFTAPNWPQCVA